MSGLLTTADAAQLAGVAEDTLHDWKRRGLIQSRGRRGRSLLWAADDVLDVERLTWERDDTGRTDGRS